MEAPNHDLEMHCRQVHARGAIGAPEPYLSETFQIGTGLTWDQVHNNLHRLASKHGEPAHYWEA